MAHWNLFLDAQDLCLLLLTSSENLKFVIARNAVWKLPIRSSLAVRAVSRLFRQKKQDAVPAFIE